MYFGYTPAPTTPQTVARYAAFLARTMTHTSILCYMNVVRIIHLEAGFPNPLHDNWYLHTVLRGIKRCRGTPPKQKLPIDPKVLMDIYHHIDLEDSMHAAFWAACLTAFFTFFRKSTLVPKSGAAKDIKVALQKGDLNIGDSVALFSVRHTKTLQFGDRTLDIPVSAIKDSVLCPVAALQRMTRHQDIPASYPLFAFQSNGRCTFLTHETFVKFLHKCLTSAGYDSKSYSGHSFRRGGASFAFSCGVPAHVIKTQGDWKSSAYTRYLSISMEQRLNLSSVLAIKLKGY